VNSGNREPKNRVEEQVAWAAAMIALLRPHAGRVLHIGPGFGALRDHLPQAYELIRGEAINTSAAEDRDGRQPSIGHGVPVRELVESYPSAFDIIILIAEAQAPDAVRDFRQSAMHMLRESGALLFQATVFGSDDRELKSPHSWSPPQQSLNSLSEGEACDAIVGCEVQYAGSEPILAGVIFKRAGDAESFRELAYRILSRAVADAYAGVDVSKLLFRLIHAGLVTTREIAALRDAVPSSTPTRPLSSTASLWLADLIKLEVAEARLPILEEQIRRLGEDVSAAASDRVQSETELTTMVVATEARLAALRADTNFNKNIKDYSAISIAESQSSPDPSEQEAPPQQASREIQLSGLRTTQSGDAWRASSIARKIARRYPVLAAVSRRLRSMGWRSTPTLPSASELARRVREKLKISLRRQRPLFTVDDLQPQNPQPVTPGAWRLPDSVVTLDATGHQPALQAPQRERDWPLVTVVITSYNYGRFIADAVDSILSQTFKDLEIIVVEAGSSEADSRFAVAALNHAKLRVLMRGSAQSVGANRNWGISQARGKYICCLDADDTLAPTYIEKCIYLLERHDFDVVSSAMQYIGQESGQLDILRQPDLGALLETNQVLTCAVFRRSLWERAGGFRDANRSVSGQVHEDWVFWQRLAFLGARFWNFAKDPMLKYRVHGANLSAGSDTHPMWLQRRLVQLLNKDLTNSLEQSIGRSKRLAATRHGTPSSPPTPVVLDRSLEKPHAPAILIAVPYLVLGGAERLLSSIVKHLVESGWRVIIVATLDPGPDSGDTTSWFDKYTTEIFRLDLGMPQEYWRDFLHHLIASRGVAALWIAGSAFAYDNLRSVKAAHPRLLVVDMLFNTIGHTRNNRRRRTFIDLNFVENREVESWLLAHGERQSRIRLIRSGVDLTHLQPRPRSESFGARIGASPKDSIIGYSGRWSEEKNPLGFVEIARRTDRSLPVRFVMTGSGHMRPQIEKAIRDAGFAKGKFHLLGEVPEIAPVMGSFDLLALPSIIDGRPMAVMEAMALGVPVLASDVGALGEIIRDGENGWLCAAGDIDAFVERVRQAVVDRDALLAMRRHARAYAERELDAQTSVAKYREALTQSIQHEHSLA
jgi:O-antigen biosynthesis protein